LRLDFSFTRGFDLPATEFVPTLRTLVLVGARLPVPRGTGATAVRKRSLRALSLEGCELDGDDFSFAYHLEGLDRLELRDCTLPALLANQPAWADLPRRMPTLGKLQIAT